MKFPTIIEIEPEDLSRCVVEAFNVQNEILGRPLIDVAAMTKEECDAFSDSLLDSMSGWSRMKAREAALWARETEATGL